MPRLRVNGVVYELYDNPSLEKIHELRKTADSLWSFRRPGGAEELRKIQKELGITVDGTLEEPTVAESLEPTEAEHLEEPAAVSAVPETLELIAAESLEPIQPSMAETLEPTVAKPLEQLMAETPEPLVALAPLNGVDYTTLSSSQGFVSDASGGSVGTTKASEEKLKKNKNARKSAATGGGHGRRRRF